MRVDMHGVVCLTSSGRASNAKGSGGHSAGSGVPRPFLVKQLETREAELAIEHGAERVDIVVVPPPWLLLPPDRHSHRPWLPWPWLPWPPTSRRSVLPPPKGARLEPCDEEGEAEEAPIDGVSEPKARGSTIHVEAGRSGPRSSASTFSALPSSSSSASGYSSRMRDSGVRSSLSGCSSPCRPARALSSGLWLEAFIARTASTWGSPWVIDRAMSSMLLPSNGRSRESISYSTTPTDQMSMPGP